MCTVYIIRLVYHCVHIWVYMEVWYNQPSNFIWRGKADTGKLQDWMYVWALYSNSTILLQWSHRGAQTTCMATEHSDISPRFVEAASLLRKPKGEDTAGQPDLIGHRTHLNGCAHRACVLCHLLADSTTSPAIICTHTVVKWIYILDLWR